MLASIARAHLRGIYDQTAKSPYTLTPEEYRDGETRRDSIRQDCKVLTYPRLRDAVRYALFMGDKAALSSYARYLPLRIGDGERGDNGEWRDRAATREKNQLHKRLTVIDGKLKDQTLAPVNKQASDLMAKASKLDRAATQRAMQSRRYAFQFDNEVKWD